MTQDAHMVTPANSNDKALDFGLYSSFLAFQSPLAVSFVAAMHGFGARPLTEDFTYGQVGVGQSAGTAFLALADSYPGARFLGTDTDPGEVDAVRRLAGEAGLQSVTVSEGKADGAGLPPCDMLVLSRLYSAASPADRIGLAKGLASRLAPGGVLCVQYSAVPGNALLDELFRLLRALSTGLDGDRTARMRGALGRAVEMARGGALFFAQFPMAAEALQQMVRSDPAVVASEVFREGAHSLSVADVLADMTEAGLVFVGSGQIGLNLPELSTVAALRPMLESLKAPEARAVVADFVRNTGARVDLFMRAEGAQARDVAETLAPFLLARATTGEETLNRQTIAQNTGVDVTAAVYTDLLAAIGSEPRSIAEILEDTAIKRHARGRALKALQIMVGTQLATLVRTRTKLTTAPLPDKVRFPSVLNRMLVESSFSHPAVRPLSSPVLGQCVVASLADRCRLYALTGGRLDDVHATLLSNGFPPHDKDGKPMSAAQFRDSIQADLPDVRARAASWLQWIGVLAAG